MKFAHEQRKEWANKLKAGEIPEEIARSISRYRKLRSKSTWRSSSFLEHLGEAAIALDEILKERKS